MSHFAVAEARDGNRVTWMERVAEEAYARGEEAERACGAR
jgi:4-carboxymuconolactone decarboxylase